MIQRALALCLSNKEETFLCLLPGCRGRSLQKTLQTDTRPAAACTSARPVTRILLVHPHCWHQLGWQLWLLWDKVMVPQPSKGEAGLSGRPQEDKNVDLLNWKLGHTTCTCWLWPPASSHKLTFLSSVSWPNCPPQRGQMLSRPQKPPRISRIFRYKLTSKNKKMR